MENRREWTPEDSSTYCLENKAFRCNHSRVTKASQCSILAGEISRILLFQPALVGETSQCLIYFGYPHDRSRSLEFLGESNCQLHDHFINTHPDTNDGSLLGGIFYVSDQNGPTHDGSREWTSLPPPSNLFFSINWSIFTRILHVPWPPFHTVHWSTTSMPVRCLWSLKIMRST